MEGNLFCLKCETNVVNDVGNWLVCYCTGREIKELGLDDYPDYWVSQETVEHYDTLEEKWL